jgi:hypothetical protein
LKEVQALSSNVNKALNKSASQSSDFNQKTVASNAVDGETDSFSHTATSDANAWWEVDLGDDYPIESVNIVNRYCQSESDPGDCLGRISYATLSLINSQGIAVYSTSLGNTTSKQNVIIFPTCESDDSPTKAPYKSPMSVSPTLTPPTKVPTKSPTGSIVTFGALSNFDTYCVVPKSCEDPAFF